MAKVFTANVVIRKARGAQPTEFSIGEEVPEWALDKVDNGVTRDSDAPTADDSIIDSDDPATGAGEGSNASTDPAGNDDEVGDYDELSVEELRGEAKERGLSGYSKLDKAGLIELLENDDAEEEA